MTHHISPYALLCACKPQPKYAPVRYDLYSAAQSADGTIPQNEQLLIPAEPHQPRQTTYDLQAEQPVNQSAQNRTQKPHYVSDIHSRHRQALSRTVQRCVQQTPPSSAGSMHHCPDA